MTAVFKLNADELEPSLIEKIKTLFAHVPIEISVGEQDATDYLLSSPASRNRLNESLQQIERGETVPVIPSDFE